MQRPLITALLTASTALMLGLGGASQGYAQETAPPAAEAPATTLAPQDDDVAPVVRMSARLARAATSGTLLSVPVNVDTNTPTHVCQHTRLLVVDAPGTERTRHRTCWDVPAGTDDWQSVIRLRVPHDQRGRTLVTWVAEAAGERFVVRRAVMVRGRSVTIS